MSFYNNHIANAYWQGRFFTLANETTGYMAINSLGEMVDANRTPFSGEFIQVGGNRGGRFALRADGSIVTDNYNTSSITTAVQISALNLFTSTTTNRSQHCAVLNSDGSVDFIGPSVVDLTVVHNWTEIVQVAASQVDIAGLKTDGTVIDTSNDTRITSWSDLVYVAGGTTTNTNTASQWLGVKADGTVVSTLHEVETSQWSNVLQAEFYLNPSNSSVQIWGLKKDGTIITTDTDVGLNQTIGSWSGVVALAHGGRRNLAAIKSDGTLYTAGSPSGDYSGFIDLTTEPTYLLEGTTSLDGSPQSVHLSIHHGDTKKLIRNMVSGVDGTYSHRVSVRWPVYVTAYADNHKPETHGPIIYTEIE